MQWIIKHTRILLIKIRLSIMEYLQYRSSLFFYTFSLFSWSIIGLFVQKSIFNEVVEIKGWTFGEFALLYGIYTFAFSFFIMFTWGSIWGDYRNSVRYGGLDMILIKPIAHRLWLTFGRFDITGFLSLLPSTFIILIAVKSQHFSFTSIQVILFLFYFFIGQYVINSILFLFYSIIFWVTSADHISTAFWSLEAQSKTPLEILPRGLRLILLTLIPIGFVAYIPTKALLGQLPYEFLIFTLIFVIILFIVNKTVWQAGLRRYESASS